MSDNMPLPGNEKKAKPSGFFPYYWNQLKKLLVPAGPVIVCAVYSFVLIFPRYHYKLFRFTLFGSQYRYAEKMAADGLWFMLLPMLAVFIFWAVTAIWPGSKEIFPQRRPGDFGWRVGIIKGWRDAGIFYLFMIPFVVFAIFQVDFTRTYPLFSLGRKSLAMFGIWQAVMLVHMLGWEFLNRGFLLFALEEKMGRWAILATAIPFALLHIGKPELEAYGSFLAAIALGWVALRARSFIPGAVLHWAVAFTVDILAVLRAGGFGQHP